MKVQKLTDIKSTSGEPLDLKFVHGDIFRYLFQSLQRMMTLKFLESNDAFPSKNLLDSIKFSQRQCHLSSLSKTDCSIFNNTHWGFKSVSCFDKMCWSWLCMGNIFLTNFLFVKKKKVPRWLYKFIKRKSSQNLGEPFEFFQTTIKVFF